MAAIITSIIELRRAAISVSSRIRVAQHQMAVEISHDVRRYHGYTIDKTAILATDAFTRATPGDDEYYGAYA